MPVLTALLVVGCAGGNPAHPASAAAKPFEGATLTLSCPDPAFAAVIEPWTKVWAIGAGATVTVSSAPLSADSTADAAIIPPAELGTWADRGDLLPVPSQLRETGHAYQWHSLLPVYQREYSSWGGQVLAVPLAGDGHILIFRSDRFADPQVKVQFEKQLHRPLTAPATWDDYSAVAGFFTAIDGRPALPGIERDATDLVNAYFRVAACLDRPALTLSTLDKQAGLDNKSQPELLAFQFYLDGDKSGSPRIHTPGFIEAAKWMQQLKPYQSADADPVVALATGRAVMAVVSLADLSRLRAEVEKQPKAAGMTLSKFGIAPQLPGSRTVLDPGTMTMKVMAPNYVPYFAGGRLGVVRKKCARPDAAFDLLAHLGSPARSIELISTPGLGVGPFRNTHLERDRLAAWYGYGFDEERTKSLQDALLASVGKTVRNPTFCLRGPDHAALNAALAVELQAIAAGKASPDDGIKRASAAWEKLDAATPRDKLRDWRRKAVGLN